MGSFYPRMIECTPQQLEENIKNWAIVMSDIDYKKAETAVIKLTRSFTYERLKVADIIEAVKAIELAGIPSAEEAWGEVTAKLDPYRRPDWSHPLIREVVVLMGYVELCRSENPGMDRAQFIKAYNNLLNRKQQEKEIIAIGGLVGGIVKQIGKVGT